MQPTTCAGPLTNRWAKSRATGGDDVFDRIKADRDKLLTSRTGQPTGELKDAAQALEAAGRRVAELQSRLDGYRAQVDRFAFLTAQIQADNRDQSWRRFAAEAQALQAHLDQIGKLIETLAADRQLFAQAGAQVRLLEQHQAAAADQIGKIGQRRQAVVQAAAALAQASSALAPRRRQLAAARVASDQAQQALAMAERLEQRRLLSVRLAELQRRQQETGAVLAQCRDLADRIDRRSEAIAAMPIDDEQLQALRRIDRELQAARIRIDAAATGLSYRLQSGSTIDCNGARLDGEGHLRLLGRTVLSIPGVGTLAVEPGGGQDLVQLGAQASRLESEQASLLQSLGLDSLAAAEERRQARSLALQDVQIQRARLDQLAPAGLDALSSGLAALAGELTQAQGRLAAIVASGDESTPPLSVEEARGALEAARLRQCSDQAAEQAAVASYAAAQGAAAHAEAELSALEAAARDEGYRQRIAQNEQELDATRQRQALLGAKVVDAERLIEAARPQVLRQDVDRLTRSARQAREAHEERQREVAVLQGALDAAGADGLEEQLAAAQGEATRAQRRHAELERRARALDLLAGLLQAKRQALTRRLQAPLLSRLNHYLQLLIPGASVTIDDELRPVSLSMANTGPVATAVEAQGDYEGLSFGTREQVSLISRLAYADLLKEAGRPTLIIIDDGLVNTDTARLTQMKRILYDAATRHQILLFSCHPERWSDLGAVAREVLALKDAHRRPELALAVPDNGD